MAEITNQNKLVDVAKLSYFKTKQDTANKETFVQGTELESKVGQLGFKTEDALKETFVEQEDNKGLSTNDYDADAKKIVDGVTDNLNKKVDKVEGSQLIETTKVTKLDGIAEGAQVNVIESISVNGTNATVQDKKASVTLDVLTSDALNGYDTTENLKETFVEKETNKGLSTNDFNNTYKGQLDTLSSTYATQASVAELIASGVVYQGSVDDLAALNAKKGTAKKGDMWNVTETDMNYVFNGTDWDPYAPMVDISGKLDSNKVNIAEESDIDSLFTV